MSNFPSSGVVNYDRVGGATCREIPTIVGKFHNPDFALGLIQHLSRPKRKLITIAHVICEKRKWRRGIVVQTSPDLTLLDLVEKLCKPVTWYHD